MHNSDDNTVHFQRLFSELKKVLNANTLENESQLIDHNEIVVLQKGEYFVKEGEIPAKITFISEGLMKYYYIDQEGREWIKHFASENDFVTSYGSYIYQTPSSYFIETMEDCILLVTNWRVYSKNISQSKTWSDIAGKYSEMIYYKKELREESFLKQDGTQRYFQFIEDNKHLVNRISIKDMVSYLGLNHVSLSRIRSQIHRN